MAPKYKPCDCDDINSLIETHIHGRIQYSVFKVLRVAECVAPCCYFAVWWMKRKPIELMKSFFPRLIDRCRQQRKALSYKPVGQSGLTLIGWLSFDNIRSIFSIGLLIHLLTFINTFFLSQVTLRCCLHGDFSDEHVFILKQCTAGHSDGCGGFLGRSQHG